MKIRHVLLFNFCVLLVFGIGFLFAPVWMLGLFDIAVDTVGILFTRLLSAAFLGILTINYLARNHTASEDVRALIGGNFVANILGFIVLLYYGLQGLGNALVWLPIFLYLFFAIAFGYCLVEPGTYEEPILAPRRT